MLGRNSRWIIALLLIACSGASHAHRMRAAITTVLFNDRTERIEVMHRFYLHDAEHAAGEIAGRSADLFGSAEDRQQFALYVQNRFSLSTPDNVLLPRALIGSEIEDDSLWVYQAIAYPMGALTGLQVSQRTLLDVWADQVNTVNVEYAGEVYTLTFNSDSATLSISF